MRHHPKLYPARAWGVAGGGVRRRGARSSPAPRPRPAPPAPPDPLAPGWWGAIRWDQWWQGNDAVGFVSDTIYDSFDYREPTLGWYTSGPTISDAQGQAIMDADIAAASVALNYWAFVWYPEPSESADVGHAQTVFGYYLASPLRTMSFCLVLQAAWAAFPAQGWANYETVFIPRWVAWMADSRYVTVNGGRRLIFLFQAASFKWPQDKKDLLRAAVQAAGLGDPFFVQVNMDEAWAAIIGLQGVTSYGPSGADLGAGHKAYADAIAKDQANWGPLLNNKATILGLTPMQDGRSRAATLPGPAWWADMATRAEWREHLDAAMAFAVANPTRVTTPATYFIYSWNELDEGGPGIVPGLQFGTQWLDVVREARLGGTPPAYSDEVNSDSLLITRAGTWSESGPFPSPSVGNWNRDTSTSSTLNSTHTLTVDDCTGFRVMGKQNTNRGIFGVTLDGGAEVLVDQYAAAQSGRMVLYATGALPRATHTLVLRVTGTKNAASSATTIAPDSYGFDVSP